MSILDFIASITKSLIWPTLILFLMFFFSKQIKDLLASLKEASLSKDGFAWKFDRTQKETEKNVVAAEIERAATLPPADRRLLDERKHPSGNVGRIDSTWNEIEKIVRDKLTLRGLATDQLGVSDLLQMAYDQNSITNNEFKSLLGLNTMRNLAVHGPSDEVDDKRTDEFLTIADAIKTVLFISNR